jgi:hypothetical protein
VSFPNGIGITLSKAGGWAGGTYASEVSGAMQVTVDLTSMRRISGWIAVAIPTVASTVYVIFPSNVVYFGREICGRAPILCVNSEYYTDAGGRVLFDMEIYGVALEELRRITPALFAICVFVMIAPLLYSGVEQQRDRISKYWLSEARKPNGRIAILLTLAALLLSAYMLFVSRSLLFIDVDSYFRVAFTAPVSIVAYWCLFLILVVGGAVAVALILVSLSTVRSKRDRGVEEWLGSRKTPKSSL